jgi:hypothetical protein
MSHILLLPPYPYRLDSSYGPQRLLLLLLLMLLLLMLLLLMLLLLLQPLLCKISFRQCKTCLSATISKCELQ